MNEKQTRVGARKARQGKEESYLSRREKSEAISNARSEIQKMANIKNRVVSFRQSPLERFSDRYVIRENKCWEWIGNINRNGYGRFWDGDKDVLANRWSLEFLGGKSISGLNACHTCDNPKCVNPDHLFAGTDLDNTRDSINKGRHWTQNYTPKTHCYKGHEFTEENTIPSKEGWRRCRICANERSKITMRKNNQERYAKGLTCRGKPRVRKASFKVFQQPPTQSPP